MSCDEQKVNMHISKKSNGNRINGKSPNEKCNVDQFEAFSSSHTLGKLSSSFSAQSPACQAARLRIPYRICEGLEKSYDLKWRHESCSSNKQAVILQWKIYHAWYSTLREFHVWGASILHASSAIIWWIKYTFVLKPRYMTNTISVSCTTHWTKKITLGLFKINFVCTISFHGILQSNLTIDWVSTCPFAYLCLRFASSCPNLNLVIAQKSVLFYH